MELTTLRGKKFTISEELIGQILDTAYYNIDDELDSILNWLCEYSDDREVRREAGDLQLKKHRSRFAAVAKELRQDMRQAKADRAGASF